MGFFVLCMGTATVVMCLKNTTWCICGEKKTAKPLKPHAQQDFQCDDNIITATDM